ncbi:MAG: VOC family protein [Spongiibacteraceae bacterium]
MNKALFTHFYTSFFQFGYVTNDVEQAMANLDKNFGVKNFLTVGEMASKVKLADGREVTNELILAFANVGDQQVELIQPVNDASGLYVGALPQREGFSMVLHHLGHRFSDLAQWNSFRDQLDLNTHKLAFENNGGSFHYLYTDERDSLGHFMEYMWLDDEGAAMFDAIPQNA